MTLSKFIKFNKDMNMGVVDKSMVAMEAILCDAAIIFGNIAVSNYIGSPEELVTKNYIKFNFHNILFPILGNILRCEVPLGKFWNFIVSSTKEVGINHNDNKATIISG